MDNRSPGDYGRPDKLIACDLSSMHGVYLFINYKDFDYSATIYPTNTFVIMLGRGRSSRSYSNYGSYESYKRGGDRGRGDGLRFRGERGGVRGGEVIVEVIR